MESGLRDGLIVSRIIGVNNVVKLGQISPTVAMVQFRRVPVCYIVPIQPRIQVKSKLRIPFFFLSLHLRSHLRFELRLSLMLFP